MAPFLRFATLLTVLFPGLLLVGCSKATAPLPVANPLPGDAYNVAIILVDTLRPDHLGSYGHAGAITPHMDALAAAGLRFENAYSASTFTGEAVSALFTGRPPAMNTTGLGWTARPTPQAENLPKRFEAAGYKTGIFSTSFVMRFRGFYDSFQEADLFPGQANSTDLDGDLTTAALAFARRHRDAPTFQYLHYYAPHAPYNPPESVLEPFSLDRDILTPSEEIHPAALVTQGMIRTDPRVAELKKHYDAEIAYIDQCIGRYLEGLESMGLREKTIVVLVSDHGEEFLEHGFADHAWNLFEETLRIPLIISAPDLIQPGTAAERVSIYDVMPTLLQLTELDHEPYEGPVSGQYLLEAGSDAWTYRPRQGPIFASLFPESRAQLHAILFDDYKYIAGPRWLNATACKEFWLLQGVMADRAKAADFLPLSPWTPIAAEALFNLQEDPSETQNIMSEAPEIRAKALQWMERYRSASAPYQEDASPTVNVDPFGGDFVSEALKRLGGEALGDTMPHSDDGRIAPEVLESLETMGYL